MGAARDALHGFSGMKQSRTHFCAAWEVHFFAVSG
jgi:hypothetical protein